MQGASKDADTVREALARAQAELERSRVAVARSRQLSEMSSLLNEALDEDELLRTFADHILAMFPATRVSVALLNDPPTTVTVHALKGSDHQLPMGTVIPIEGTAVGTAVRDGRTIVVEELAEAEFADSRALAASGLRSSVCAPLRIRRAAIGTLNFGAMTPSAFADEDEVARIEEAAAVLASNMEARRQVTRARSVLSETQDYARRLASLTEMGQALSFATTEEELFKITTQYTSRVLPADRVSVALMSEDGERCTLYGLRSSMGAVQLGELTPLAGTGPGESILSRSIIHVPDFATSELREGPRMAKGGLKSCLIAPMLVGNRVLGSVNCASMRADSYGKREEDLLLHLASYIGVTIVNIRRNTELTRAKEASELARAAAESANLEKSNFLARMSHELRTPLNGILGYAQILSRGREASEEQRSGLAVIQRSGEHLLSLINDILDISKIENRKLALNIAEFSLPEVLQNIAEVFRVRAGMKGLTFTYKALNAIPPVVSGDEQRLRQVLLNLLGNATKFTKQGGVTFTVENREETLRFQIEDSGVGIAEADLHTIFEPFRQVGVPKTMSDGTGLGLAISRELVELMGGELKVQSRIGQGSVFWFEISLPKGELPQTITAAEVRHVSGYLGSPRRVLVADDVWENRSTLVNMLAPLGFEMHEAEDGLSALQKCRELHPDVVLLDLRMPHMDGTQIIRTLRADPKTADLKILIISASAYDDDRQESLNAGANGFIAKPFRMSQLLDVLGRLLELRWTYDGEDPTDSDLLAAEAAAKAGEPEPPGAPAFPPVETLTRLLTLAKRGDVQAIGKTARDLERKQPRFASFADKILQLARRFALKELRSTLERAIAASGENE